MPTPMTAQELLDRLLTIRNNVEAMRDPDQDLELHIDTIQSPSTLGQPAIQFWAIPRLSAAQAASVQDLIDAQGLPTDIETVIVHET